MSVLVSGLTASLGKTRKICERVIFREESKLWNLVTPYFEMEAQAKERFSRTYDVLNTLCLTSVAVTTLHAPESYDRASSVWRRNHYEGR